MKTALPTIWIFFYGTFMSRLILAEHNVAATEILSAKLNGFKLYIRPRVNLTRTDKTCFYGTLAAVTHQDIFRIYATLKKDFGLRCLPEAVLAETLDGAFKPAL